MEHETRPKRTQTLSYGTGPCKRWVPEDKNNPTTTDYIAQQNDPCLWKTKHCPVVGGPSLACLELPTTLSLVNKLRLQSHCSSLCLLLPCLTNKLISLYSSWAQLLQLTFSLRSQREIRPSLLGLTSPSCSQPRGPSITYLIFKVLHSQHSPGIFKITTIKIIKYSVYSV